MPLYELPQQYVGGADSDSFRAQVILGPGGAYLPGRHGGKACDEVPESGRNRRVARLAFDESDWLAARSQDEVDLTSIDVAEITQLALMALRIDLILRPLEQLREARTSPMTVLPSQVLPTCRGPPTNTIFLAGSEATWGWR